ncbi:hypothetical protein DERF_012308 [Dermatophagoides farinae]|uniref:Uncharacterized protein n=1 Tax=Dermatophagoides farinae TaxID=6954 RepID=A0A922HPS2_DERFA|nr:hypothetical protein DERF_012308 [Dermatophagoides farinae]
MENLNYCQPNKTKINRLIYKEIVIHETSNNNMFLGQSTISITIIVLVSEHVNILLKILYIETIKLIYSNP